MGDAFITNILRIVITELVAAYDLRQVGPNHRDFRGWHWTPGDDFKVRLSPRPPPELLVGADRPHLP
jgi:hypothetical protein